MKTDNSGRSTTLEQYKKIKVRKNVFCKKKLTKENDNWIYKFFFIGCNEDITVISTKNNIFYGLKR